MRFRSLDLHLTDKCNLRCQYCYYFNLAEDKKKDFPQEYINLLPIICQRLGVDTLTFYGGEPTLVPDLIEACCERTSKLKIRYSIVTNGTICNDKILSLMKKYNISVQRSIDGCPEACDPARAQKVNDYLRNTKLYGDYRKPRRSTITEDKVSLLYRSWLWLKKNGFGEGWTPIPDCYHIWSESSIKTFVDQCWLIAKDMVETAKRTGVMPYFYWFHRLAPVVDVMRKRIPFNPGPMGCGAGSGLIALRQDGCFVACHRFVSEPIHSDWVLGHVYDVVELGKLPRPRGKAEEAIRKMKKEFNSAPELQECKQCPVRQGCAGGCYHVNLYVNGNAAIPDKVFCALRRGCLPIVEWIDDQLGPNWAKKGKRAQGEQRTSSEQIAKKECTRCSAKAIENIVDKNNTTGTVNKDVDKKCVNENVDKENVDEGWIFFEDNPILTKGGIWGPLERDELENLT